MGRALARLMAERGHELFLLGRGGADLEKSARDLEALAGRGHVGTAPCDRGRPEGFAAALEAAESALGGRDTVVVTAGAFATQDRLEEDPELARTRRSPRGARIVSTARSLSGRSSTIRMSTGLPPGACTSASGISSIVQVPPRSTGG